MMRNKSSMIVLHVVVVLLQTHSWLVCLPLALAADDQQEVYEMYSADLKSAFQSIKNQSSGSINDRTNLTDWSMLPIGSDFKCQMFSNPGPAKTVHKLTPYDIKVVGALGDSITAAMGAKACTIITDIIEYRGVSWSIGGDSNLDKVTTIPNIIKKYNPKVKGYSVKSGRASSKNANLNVAASGAIAQNMPGQARKLVDKLKSDPEVDFENDWKLVTLWIGGNNLCKYCRDKTKHSPQEYVGNIKEALDILHKEGDESETSKASTDYQEHVNELIASQRYNDRDDFTVVVQPFFIGVELPLNDKGQPDKSYFAPDCFHFSSKGHREAAVALWNNMIEPVGAKTTGWTIGGDIQCPTEDAPYFYTEKNSNYQTQLKTNENDSSTQRQVSLVTLLGLSAGILFAIMILVVVVVVVMLHHKRRKNNPEFIPLVNGN